MKLCQQNRYVPWDCGSLCSLQITVSTVPLAQGLGDLAPPFALPQASCMAARTELPLTFTMQILIILQGAVPSIDFAALRSSVKCEHNILHIMYNLILLGEHLQVYGLPSGRLPSLSHFCGCSLGSNASCPHLPKEILPWERAELCSLCEELVVH